LPLFSKREIYALEWLQTEGECKGGRLPEAKQHTAHTHMCTYVHTYYIPTYIYTYTEEVI